MDYASDMMARVLDFAILGLGTVLWWMLKDIKQTAKEQDARMDDIDSVAKENRVRLNQHEKFNESIDNKLTIISSDITALKVLLAGAMRSDIK